MELQAYLDILWRRRGLVVITVAVATVVAILGVLLIRPNYTAYATLRVEPRAGATIDYGALEYTTRLKNTYAQLAVSNTTLQVVQQSIGVDRPVGLLRENITVEFPANNELMTVVAQDADPTVAAGIANAVAGVLREDSQSSRSARLLNVELIDPAVVPTSPDRSSLLLIIAMGVLASLVAGLGLAFLLDSLDRRVQTPAQIADLTRLPLLAQVPAVNGQPQLYNGTSPVGEVFRQLRTSITLQNRDEPKRSLVISSAEPNEGKSLVAANLAYSMAQLGQKVLLVDGDLRMPTLHTIFNIPNEVGLSSVLYQDASLDTAIRYVESSKVYVLPSGPKPGVPGNLLSEQRLKPLLEQLTARFDMVLIDTPAYLAVSDGPLLAASADGVLLVVRCAQTHRDHLRSAHSQMQNAGVRLIGVVANGTEENKLYRYYQQAQK